MSNYLPLQVLHFILSGNQLVHNTHHVVMLTYARGHCGSLFSKLGDLGRAVQAFEVLNSSEVGADEIAYSQMIHCYGCAGCLDISLFESHSVQFTSLSYLDSFASGT